MSAAATAQGHGAAKKPRSHYKRKPRRDYTATREAPEPKDRRRRKPSGAAPSVKRVRAWERWRNWKANHRQRRAARELGTFGRTLIAQQRARAASRRPQLYPMYVPELLQDTSSGIALAIVGWVAFAWVLHGRSQLVASYDELAWLIGCSKSSVEKWVATLCDWGWLLSLEHYTPDQSGEVHWQDSNSYSPGLLLRMAIAAANDRRSRGERASFFAPNKQDRNFLGCVAARREESKNLSDARALVAGCEQPVDRSVSPQTATKDPAGRGPASRVARPSDAPSAAATTTTGLSREGVAEEAAAGANRAAGAPGCPVDASSGPAEGSGGLPDDAACGPPRTLYPGRTVVVRHRIDELTDGGRRDPSPQEWLRLIRGQCGES